MFTKIMIPVIACCLTIGTFVPRANAGILITAGEGGELSDGFAEINTVPKVLLCVVLLPFCLLDESKEVSHLQQYNDLLANGYTDSEISQILKDQAELTLRMSQQQKRLVISKTETVLEIGSQLRSIYPDISPEYVNFLYENSQSGGYK